MTAQGKAYRIALEELRAHCQSEHDINACLPRDAYGVVCADPRPTFAHMAEAWGALEKSLALLLAQKGG